LNLVKININIMKHLNLKYIKANNNKELNIYQFKKLDMGNL